MTAATIPTWLVSDVQAMCDGTAPSTWHIWWDEHATELEALLTRTQFLQLKFGRLSAAAELVAAQGYPVRWTARGRQLRAWSRLHRDALDAAGKPVRAAQMQAYRGAPEDFAAGRTAAGAAKLRAVLDESLREEGAIGHGLAAGEAVLDAEYFLDEGHPDVAREFAMFIAELSCEDEFLAPAISAAKRLLARIG